MRRPAIVLGLACITMVALLVALGLILFSVNPTTQSNQDEIEKAISAQHAITCAQVQTTANAYRFRSLTPSGDVEPIRHFLTRMQAQQQTLRLARGSECKSAPGFPPVGLQVRRALAQIHRILQSFEPRLREPISRHEPTSHTHEGFPQGFFVPPNAGIGEEGVPATLAPILAPSAPVEAEKGTPAPAPKPKGLEQAPVAPEVPAPEAAPEPVPIPTPVPKPILPIPKVEVEIVKGKVKAGTQVVDASISIAPIEEGE